MHGTRLAQRTRAGVARREIHDCVAQTKERIARQRFREEVGHVGDGGDEWDDELLVLHELAHVEIIGWGL
eukprot:4235401-Prymnesium_polylepis.1